MENITTVKDVMAKIRSNDFIKQTKPTVSESENKQDSKNPTKYSFSQYIRDEKFMYNYNWDTLLIDNQPVTDILKIAINKLIDDKLNMCIKHNEDHIKITVSVKDIFIAAGLDDIFKTRAMISEPNVSKITIIAPSSEINDDASYYIDEEGRNWRFYALAKVLKEYVDGGWTIFTSDAELQLTPIDHIDQTLKKAIDKVCKFNNFFDECYGMHSFWGDIFSIPDNRDLCKSLIDSIKDPKIYVATISSIIENEINQIEVSFYLFFHDTNRIVNDAGCKCDVGCKCDAGCKCDEEEITTSSYIKSPQQVFNIQGGDSKKSIKDALQKISDLLNDMR